MQDISVLLDSDPSPESCIEMVECDILQKQAHEELCSYNDKKQFSYVHPITIGRQKTAAYVIKLENLRQQNPEAFLNEIANNSQNIRRIESNIRNKKYKDDATLESWKSNLELAKQKQELISSLMQ